MFIEDLRPFFNVDEFASRATLDGQEIVGILDETYDEAQLGGMAGIAGSSPRFTTPTQDLPENVEGRVLEINRTGAGSSTFWRVTAHEPDGLGVSVLRLEVFMTEQLAIQRRLLEALLAPPELASGRVYANRVDPLTVGEQDRIVINLDMSRSTPFQTLGAPIVWTTVYVVVCESRVSTGADPIAAVDALLNSAYTRIRTLPINAVGNTVEQVTVESQIKWEVERLDTLVSSATFSVVVQHRTSSNSLEVA